MLFLIDGQPGLKMLFIVNCSHGYGLDRRNFSGGPSLSRFSGLVSLTLLCDLSYLFRLPDDEVDIN